MSKPVNVRIRPALMRLHGKTYAIGGNVWLEVPEGTTMADLPRFMVYSPTLPEPEPSDRWQVAGSTGSTYTVTKLAGSYICTCPGYQFRKACKHSAAMAEKQAGRA